MKSKFLDWMKRKQSVNIHGAYGHQPICLCMSIRLNPGMKSTLHAVFGKLSLNTALADNASLSTSHVVHFHLNMPTLSKNYLYKHSLSAGIHPASLKKTFVKRLTAIKFRYQTIYLPVYG